MERVLQEFAQYLRSRLLLPEAGIKAYVSKIGRVVSRKDAKIAKNG